MTSTLSRVGEKESRQAQYMKGGIRFQLGLISLLKVYVLTPARWVIVHYIAQQNYIVSTQDTECNRHLMHRQSTPMESNSRYRS